MVDLWENLITSDIWVTWDGPVYGLINGLFNQKGLLDTTPLKEYLENLWTKSAVTGQLHRKLILGTVDANAGEFIGWTENNVDSLDDLPLLTLASGTMPAVFPFVEY